ncbi:uncharacterized protein DUF1826 [Marinomonas alcarazii]|uniref:Uncharacterized protein DUF1826 n=1 Tax=Marinomonas alcarazii TaxID=491949 RepID=A0A318UZI4_9GAMM|nr:DUF1826 domain-containing protein [Marinomonas alcarazii]PYF80931.1 uncharacterized protein DUF1826 [Marinomonas alcarazii]
MRENLSFQKVPHSVDLKNSHYNLIDTNGLDQEEGLATKPALLGVVKSSHREVLADIYQNNISMAVWQRSLGSISQYAESLLESSPHFAFTSQGSLEYLSSMLGKLLPEAQGKALFVEDVALLVDMFACLFDLEEVGLRLNVLSNAMCPRFHVDKIPCRLVSTYAGSGSEWLHEAHVVRDRLGRGGRVNDHNSGLNEKGRINQLNVGDVALMKGDEWPTSLGRGVVHRSPSASLESKRLFLSLDMI